MSNMNTLNATKREETGKGPARRLRAEGKVPVVLYGKDTDSVHLTVDAREAEHLFHEISVENTIVGLELEGEDEPVQTLVREIQTHPVRADLLHVDFLRITAGVAVSVEVPVRLNGVPHGVKHQGGVLEQVIHELPVRCIPSKIPESFEIDVTELEINEALHVYDLELEEGVEVTIAPERTICAVAIPKILEEPEEEEEELLEGAELLEGEEGELPEGEEAPEGEAEAEVAEEDEEDEG